MTLLEKGPELGGVWHRPGRHAQSSVVAAQPSFTDFGLPAFVETVRESGAYPPLFADGAPLCARRGAVGC